MQLNKVSNIYTLGRLAAELGEDEDYLFDIIDGMEPEDGLIWVFGLGEEQYPAFTSDGIDHLKYQLAIYKDNPDLLPEL